MISILLYLVLIVAAGCATDPPSLAEHPADDKGPPSYNDIVVNFRPPPPYSGSFTFNGDASYIQGPAVERPPSHSHGYIAELLPSMQPPPYIHRHQFRHCNGAPEQIGDMFRIPFDEPQIHTLSDDDVFKILKYPPKQMALEFVIRLIYGNPEYPMQDQAYFTTRKISDSKALVNIPIHRFTDPANDYEYYGFNNNRNRFHTLYDAIKFYQSNELRHMSKFYMRENIFLGQLVFTPQIMKYYASSDHWEISNHFVFQLSRRNYWNRPIIPTGFALRARCFIFPNNYDGSSMPHIITDHALAKQILYHQTVGSFILRCNERILRKVKVLQFTRVVEPQLHHHNRPHLMFSQDTLWQFNIGGSRFYAGRDPKEPTEPRQPYYYTFDEYAQDKINQQTNTYLVPKLEVFYELKKSQKSYAEKDEKMHQKTTFFLQDQRLTGEPTLHELNSQRATHLLATKSHGSFLYRISMEPDIHFILSFVMKPGLQTLNTDWNEKSNRHIYPEVQVFHMKIYKCKPNTLLDPLALTMDEESHDILTLTQLTADLRHGERHMYVLNDKLKKLRIPVKLTTLIEPQNGVELERKTCIGNSVQDHSKSQAIHREKSRIGKASIIKSAAGYTKAKHGPHLSIMANRMHLGDSDVQEQSTSHISHIYRVEVQKISRDDACTVLRQMGPFHYLFREAKESDKRDFADGIVVAVYEVSGLLTIGAYYVYKCRKKDTGTGKRIFHTPKHDLMLHGCDNENQDEHFKSIEDVQKHFIHKKVPPAASEYEIYVILSTPYLKKKYPNPQDATMSLTYVSEKKTKQVLRTLWSKFVFQPPTSTN